MILDEIKQKTNTTIVSRINIISNDFVYAMLVILLPKLIENKLITHYLIHAIISFIIALVSVIVLPKLIENKRVKTLKELVSYENPKLFTDFTKEEIEKLEVGIITHNKQFVSDLNEKIKESSHWQTLAIFAPWGSGKTTKIKIWMSKTKENYIYANDWLLNSSNNFIYKLISQMRNSNISDLLKEKIKKFLEKLFIEDVQNHLPKNILLERIVEFISEIDQELNQNFYIIIDEIDRGSLTNAMSLIDQIQIIFGIDNFTLNSFFEKRISKFKIIYLVDKSIFDKKVLSHPYSDKESLDKFYNKYFHNILDIAKFDSVAALLEEISLQLDREEIYWTAMDTIKEEILTATIKIDRRKIYQNLSIWKNLLINVEKEGSFFKALIMINHILENNKDVGQGVDEIDYPFKDVNIMKIVEASQSCYASSNNTIPNLIYRTYFYDIQPSTPPNILETKLNNFVSKYKGKEIKSKKINIADCSNSLDFRIEQDMGPKLMQYGLPEVDAKGNSGGKRVIYIDTSNYVGINSMYPRKYPYSYPPEIEDK